LCITLIQLKIGDYIGFDKPINGVVEVAFVKKWGWDKSIIFG